MAYQETQYPNFFHLSDNGPALGAYEENGSTRPALSMQGNYMQPHDHSIETLSSFDSQPMPPSGLHASEVVSKVPSADAYRYAPSDSYLPVEYLKAPYSSYPNVSTNSFDPCSSQLASHNFVHDSAYGTITGSDPANSSVSTGPGFSDANYIQSSHAQPAINLNNQKYLAPLSTDTGYTESSINTGECFVDPMQDLSQWNHPEVPSHGKSKKRINRASSDDEGDDHREAKRKKISPSYLIGASAEQEAKLEQQLSDWDKRDRLPLEKEIRAVATLTQLPFYKVAMWYGDRLRLTPQAIEQSAASTPSSPDPTILQDIAKYISGSKNKACSTSHSRKAIGGKYVCTWDCGYSTDQRDAWIRHEEKRQPQKFWHCVSCRTARKLGHRQEPFIVHRADKFLPHAEKCQPSENADELRAKSKVPYNAPFVRKCTFCSNTFRSWKERNEHYFQHFEEMSQDDPLDLPSSGDSSDGDDDGSEDSDSGNDEGKSLPTRFAGTNSTSFPVNIVTPNPGFRSSNNNGGNGSYNTRDGASSSKSLAPPVLLSACESDGSSDTEIMDLCENFDRGDLTERKLAAHWLIQVEDYRIVEAHPELRYLALKYSAPQGAMPGCLESSQDLQRPVLPAFDELPVAFRKAFGLAKDMGFEYLWIDLFCGLKKAMGGTDSVYRQANLILVIGHPLQYTDKLWHFACDYRHFSTVQSWPNQSVSFHHLQQLGHGAYSVVDKVQLQPTQETFARKIVFRTKRTPNGHHVEEIEIMRKLRHPHIARFVAAYYDHGAFNILMSPVADCDLRKYLACPGQFPEKRRYLPGWFMSLAEALAYIHRRQCRHKDIKPANVLISGSRVLLTDFGTSFDFSTTQSTSTGSALMTPKYCAPEVAAKGSRGRSADVFSLGCVFAEMITVDLGKSLEDLHNWLRIEEESTERYATYHANLAELINWLKRLGSMRLGDSQKRVLRSCVGMLDEYPGRRPTAVEITKTLCPKESCHGLERNATCHCCPREAQSVLHDTGMDLTANPHPLFQATQNFAPPVVHKVRLSLAIFRKSDVLSKLAKSPGCQIAFVFLLVQIRPPDFNESSKVQQAYCSNKGDAILLRRVYHYWWRGVDLIPTFLCKPTARKSACDNVRAVSWPVEQANDRGSCLWTKSCGMNVSKRDVGG